MTDEQKFIFDLKGFLVLPGVLKDDEVQGLKVQVEKIRTDPASLPPHQRALPGGAAEFLIDQPALMDILHVIIGKTEKIRMEACHYTRRANGEGEWRPHAGGRTVNPNYSYQYHDGKVYAGMTRVVWELNAVPENGGATAFMPGSHKANFPIPSAAGSHMSTLSRDSGLFESYTCPAGSLVIFSEAVCHSADFWRHPDHPRMALFFAYNHINVRHHIPKFPKEVIEGLSKEHQRFFREVYHPQFDRPPFV